MATISDPWGRTPLTAEGLADHPLTLSDFNQDAGGYWRIIRGQKTYYPREWFDATGAFTGTNTQPGDRAGQDRGFFKTGTRWNWTTGQWENPTKWANVIGLAAAGGVGAGIAAPVIAGALGGGGAAAGAAPSVGEALGTGVGLGETGAVTGLAGSGFGAGGGLGLAAAPTVANLAGTSSAIGGATAPSVGSQIVRGLTGTGGSMGAYDWLGPVVNASLNLVGTNQQAGATADAAQKQLEATKYAADAQAKAAAESLAFQRQQAAYDAVSAESTRSANYDQWAAKQQQLGSVGQALGLPARAIPAYVPLPPSGLSAPGAPPAAAPPADGTAPAPAGGADAAWWNPQDARGSVERLLAGKAPTSQTILALAPQLQAAGIQVSPANAEGVTSKINIPGIGWTRVLDGGVAGGQGTGWTFVPQGVGGGGGGAVPTQGRQGQPAYMADPLGSVQQYFLDPRLAGGQLKLPTGQLGSVGSYF